MSALFFILLIPIAAKAQTLEADYQLQDVFTSSIASGIGPLVPSGSGITFTSASVNGHLQEVLGISPGMSSVTAGVRAQTNPFVNGSNYSIVLLASFDLTSVGVLATKVFDFQNLSSDAGLYINNETGNLEFVNGSSVIVATGVPGTNLTTNEFIQLALTRDSATNTVNVYETDLSGTTTLAFTFNDSTGLAILGDSTNSGNQFLNLYKDDGLGVGGGTVDEGSQGQIARLRLYNGVLSADQIAGLDTTIPEPSTWALLGIGAAAVVAAARRRI